jgi:hypothetical protein
MKTRRFVIILATLFFSGCLQATLNLPPDKDKLKKIEAGTLENSLLIIAGKPDRIVKSKNGYRIYYYRESLTSDCGKDLQTCIPIVLEKGKVAAVGHQWVRAWEQRHKRQAALAPPEKAGQATAEEQAATSQKIAQLESQVRAIPMSRTVDNLNIYRYLLRLDPENQRYKNKVVFYEDRFEKEKAERIAVQKQIWATRKWQNARLRKFKGNRQIQMAAKILGNGKFYIWLKNIGKTPFKVTAEQFFLSCKKGKRFKIYSSRDFGRELKPGAIIEGRVTFNITCNPREIVYANPRVGTLSRTIPLPGSESAHPE